MMLLKPLYLNIKGELEMKACTIDGCEGKYEALGFCNMHYKRHNKGQDMKAPSLQCTRNEPDFLDNYIPVTETGCWLWTGSLVGGGYGRFGVDGEDKIAHRYSWELHNGPIPKGLNALHKCDTPACINPDHLFIGTQKDNMQDCVKKGRYVAPTGERNAQSKLKNEDVIKIRKLRKQGLTCEALGGEFDVSGSTICQVCNNKAWKHV